MSTQSGCSSNSQRPAPRSLTPTQKSLTPTQKRILELLSDGMPHKRCELRTCLPDDMGSNKNLGPHIKAVRRYVESQGEEIICEIYNRWHCYRHVRLLKSCHCRCS